MFSLDNFSDCFCAEVVCNLINLSCFRTGRPSAISNFRVHFTFDLRLYQLVLVRTTRLFGGKFIIVQFGSPYVPLKPVRMRRMFAPGYLPVAFTVSSIFFASASVLPAYTAISLCVSLKYRGFREVTSA